MPLKVTYCLCSS